jgi:iron complex transport system substrate-binding protein
MLRKAAVAGLVVLGMAIGAWPSFAPHQPAPAPLRPALLQAAPRQAALRNAAVAPPRRIVSLNPCLDAMLVEVADAGQIAALSSYSGQPGQSSMDVALARRFAASDGSLEDVVARQPDLVLDTTFASPSAAQAYARLGLRRATFGIASTIDESKAQVLHLANLVGHPERGVQLAARIDAAVAKGAAPEGSPRPTALLWHDGGRVAGEHTLIAQLLTKAGFTNYSAAKGYHQSQAIALETVLADPPQLMLTLGAGRGIDHASVHPALQKLTAVQWYSIDPSLEFCGGPTIMRVMDRFSQIRRAGPLAPAPVQR